MSQSRAANRSTILILFEYPTISGGELSMLSALSQLRGRPEAEFLLAAPVSGPLIDEFRRRRFRHLVLEATAVENWPEILKQIVQENDVSLVHANSLSMSRRLGRVAAELGIPCTGHLRDIIRLNAKAVSDLNSNTALVAVSQATRQFHIDQGICADRIEMIHNGVDLDRFQLRPSTGFLKRELGLAEETQLALNVGQVCLRKGHDLLAQAAILLKDRCPGLHWVVCGERYSGKAESIEFELQYRAAFESAGIVDRLHCIGFRQDISEIMNEADVLVHAARQEPLGRVLLEAAASALPVVATRVGGTPEILEDSVSGLLVPADSPRQLAEAVHEVLQNRGQAREFGIAARKTAVERFSSADSAGKLWTFWSGITSSRIRTN